MNTEMTSPNRDSLEFVNDIAFRQAEIDIMKCESEYDTYSRLLDLNNIFTEAEEAKDDGDPKVSKSKAKKFAEMISKSFRAISGAMGSGLNALADKIAKDDRYMNVDDYLNSREGEIRMDKDIREIQKKVKREAAEADDLIAKIAKGTHVAPETIDTFVQTTNNIFDEHGPAIITAAAATAVYANQVKIYDDARRRDNKDGIYQQCASMEGQTQIRQISNAVHNMTAKETKQFSIFMNEFDKLRLKEEKRKNNE